MPTLAPREKKIVMVTTAVALFALLYHFLLEPFFREWRGLATEIRVTEARLRKTRLLLRKKSEIERDFQKYRASSKD